MGQRLELHAVLLEITPTVYFQPPASLTMSFPCIVYARDRAEAAFADNQTYRSTKRYQVTVIDQDPDSLIPDKVAALPYTTFDRWFAVGNLNHDVYDVYF